MVRWNKEKEKGGVLQPEDTCPKTDHPALDVLRSKHPEAHPPSEKSLEAYRGNPPVMILVEIRDAMVATVAR